MLGGGDDAGRAPCCWTVHFLLLPTCQRKTGAGAKAVIEERPLAPRSNPTSPLHTICSLVARLGEIGLREGAGNCCLAGMQVSCWEGNSSHAAAPEDGRYHLQLAMGGPHGKACLHSVGTIADEAVQPVPLLTHAHLGEPTNPRWDRTGRTVELRLSTTAG